MNLGWEPLLVAGVKIDMPDRKLLYLGAILPNPLGLFRNCHFGAAVGKRTFIDMEHLFQCKYIGKSLYNSSEYLHTS